MIQIAEMIQKAKAEGYNEANAEAKVCQDIVLTLISQTSMNRNITVKGGVVMRSISHDARRATQHILDNYDILTILEKNQLWKLVLKKVTVYRSQDDELSIQLYPNWPK